MARLLLDLIGYDLRRLRCWRYGHVWTDRAEPVCCLWCGRRGY